MTTPPSPDDVALAAFVIFTALVAFISVLYLNRKQTNAKTAPAAKQEALEGGTVLVEEDGKVVRRSTRQHRPPREATDDAFTPAKTPAPRGRRQLRPARLPGRPEQLSAPPARPAAAEPPLPSRPRPAGRRRPHPPRRARAGAQLPEQQQQRRQATTKRAGAAASSRCLWQCALRRGAQQRAATEGILGGRLPACSLAVSKGEVCRASRVAAAGSLLAGLNVQALLLTPP